MKPMNPFESELLKSISNRKGDKYFIACSGGPDSVVLFHLLYDLSKKKKFKIGLIHLNHQLRGKASTQDERFVKNLAKKYKVSFYSEKKNIKSMKRGSRLSLEEIARHERYDFFCRVAKKYRAKKVLLAHTLDDQAETVLMRVLQGTGIRGLTGIRKQLRMKGVTFERPLLSFQKKDLLGYAKRHKIKYCKDRSNQSKKFLRNWIRLELIPKVETHVNPRVTHALARIPAILAEDNQVLESLEADAWKTVYRGKKKNKISISRPKFIQLQPSIRFRVLNQALHTLDPASGMSYEAWQRLKPKLALKRYRCSLPRKLDFALTPSTIDIYKP